MIKNIDCGYSLEPPQRGGSNEYSQSIYFKYIFLNMKYDKYQNFYLKNFQFFGGGKIFNIFNRSVFRNCRQDTLKKQKTSSSFAFTQPGHCDMHSTRSHHMWNKFWSKFKSQASILLKI